MWEVKETELFRSWYEQLDDETMDAVDIAIEKLAEVGPTLGRPLVERIHSSDFHNMKELRPLGTSVRILFAFDPHQAALLLAGGDKQGKWNKWYDKNVPEADRQFTKYLESYEREERGRE